MKKTIRNIAIIMILSACGNKGNKTETQKLINENVVELSAAQMKSAGLTTTRVGRQNISAVLHVNGSIDVPPQNMVSISAPLGGYLKSTKLLPGSHVQKGEQIAVMEDPQYITIQQDYLTTRAELNYAESEYRRLEALNQSKAASDKSFQEAQMNYNSKKIMLRSLSEKLRLIGINPDALNEGNLSRSVSILSPINGYVSKVNVNIGKYANPADILFELVNPQDIHLALTVFEKDIDKLFIGQKLLAYNNHNPGKKYPCEVILIGQDLSKDRSVIVHCHFEKYDKSLIPGMYMNAEVEVQTANATVLPEDAVVQFEGRQYVFQDQGAGKFLMREVQTGNAENGMVEVHFIDSLDLEKSLFVNKGAYSVLMKMKNASDEE